jgi:hypothetical protein
MAAIGWPNPAASSIETVRSAPDVAGVGDCVRGLASTNTPAGFDLGVPGGSIDAWVATAGGGLAGHPLQMKATASTTMAAAYRVDWMAVGRMSRFLGRGVSADSLHRRLRKGGSNRLMHA